MFHQKSVHFVNFLFNFLELTLNFGCVFLRVKEILITVTEITEVTEIRRDHCMMERLLERIAMRELRLEKYGIGVADLTLPERVLRTLQVTLPGLRVMVLQGGYWSW